jgi:hypothetical protein
MTEMDGGLYIGINGMGRQVFDNCPPLLDTFRVDTYSLLA